MAPQNSDCTNLILQSALGPALSSASSLQRLSGRPQSGQDFFARRPGVLSGPPCEHAVAHLGRGAVSGSGTGDFPCSPWSVGGLQNDAVRCNHRARLDDPAPTLRAENKEGEPGSKRAAASTTAACAARRLRRGRLLWSRARAEGQVWPASSTARSRPHSSVQAPTRRPDLVKFEPQFERHAAERHLEGTEQEGRRGSEVGGRTRSCLPFERV